MIRTWTEDDVSYAGDVVFCDGGSYQARKDTSKRPPHADWKPLALPGRDAISPVIRGTFVDGGNYQRFNIVALGGSSFIAKCDTPGACPGDDWQLIASAGKPGKPGPAGPPGQAGPIGPTGPRGADGFVAKRYRADRAAYALVPINERGIEGEPIPLRELFEQFHSELR
jgi:hypothetical protein